MYTQEQLNQVRKYEKSIRDATPKALCNARAVTEMQFIIRNLLDHIEDAPLTNKSSQPDNVMDNYVSGWKRHESTNDAKDHSGG